MKISVTDFSASIGASVFKFCVHLQVDKVYCVNGGVVEVVGSNLARGKIFTASIGSVYSLYLSVFIYCVNLHHLMIPCSSKAMMFVKLYFPTSDILYNFTCILGSIRLSFANEIDGMHLNRTNIRRVLH